MIQLKKKTGLDDFFMSWEYYKSQLCKSRSRNDDFSSKFRC